MMEGMWLFWDILVCVLGVGVKHRIQNNGFEGLSTKVVIRPFPPVMVI